MPQLHLSVKIYQMYVLLTISTDKCAQSFTISELFFVVLGEYKGGYMAILTTCQCQNVITDKLTTPADRCQSVSTSKGIKGIDTHTYDSGEATGCWMGGGVVLRQRKFRWQAGNNEWGNIRGYRVVLADWLAIYVATPGGNDW